MRKAVKTTMVVSKEDVRAKIMSDYFQNYSRYHRIWMQELADRVKDRGEFGIHKFMLADYYQHPKDKELALFASLVVSENDNIIMQVEHLGELLTDNPTEWYRNRGFVRLGINSERSKYIRGSRQPYWRLANVMARCWDIEHPTVPGNSPTIWKDRTDLESEVLQTMRTTHTNPFGAFTYYLTDVGVGQFIWSLNFLALRLFRNSGLGMGLWGTGNEELMCPWNSELSLFLKTWFPDYRRVGSPEQCVKLFELDDDVDFFYAWLGYKELQKRSPKICREYATTYQRWYEMGVNKKPYRFRRILPEITI